MINENICKITTCRNSVRLALLLGVLILASPIFMETYAGEAMPVTGNGSNIAGSPWWERLEHFVKPPESLLRKRLTKLQFNVTQKEGTEKPFNNQYWNHKKEGIYVDIVSGEPLFSSTDKYSSGTGWPSFARPILSNALVTKSDISFFGARIEVRSAIADSHIGHLFNDGPAPTGLRYCINSASLDFISKEELSEKGYAQFLPLFK